MHELILNIVYYHINKTKYFAYYCICFKNANISTTKNKKALKKIVQSFLKYEFEMQIKYCSARRCEPVFFIMQMFITSILN